MILLAGFYHDSDPQRRGELLECLRRNVANDRIDEVHLFIEDAIEPETILPTHANDQRSKLTFISLGRRVTFQFLFNYANENLKGRTVIIANADIFFDETLELLNGYDLTGKLLCLSRWDVHADGSVHFFEQPASHDAWIFQPPIREFPGDFHLGLLGCDGRIAWEAANAGLRLANPSRSLRANHLHLSQVRRYKWEWLPGSTTVVPAVFLETPYPSPLGHAPDLPRAGVVFREAMGYTIAQLQTGASSHKNDTRPFVAIPQTLAGLQFTQVVAWAVSPVEVEFLTNGKLFVLVGNDWEGHQPATAWLGQKGFREGVPVVETQRGTGFEVWSLIGDAGQRYVLPTQVMLAADHLVRG